MNAPVAPIYYDAGESAVNKGQVHCVPFVNGYYASFLVPGFMPPGSMGDWDDDYYSGAKQLGGALIASALAVTATHF